jgi:DNA-binding IclR family transcriptional regulator
MRTEWSFLTNHARALVCISHDPGVRLRDIASTLGITERSAYEIVTDLTEAGYVLKKKEGRRNRYQIQAHLPVRGGVGRERTIGEVLRLLVDTNHRKRPPGKTRVTPEGGPLAS